MQKQNHVSKCLEEEQMNIVTYMYICSTLSGENISLNSGISE